MAKKLTKSKAKKILHDKEVHGHPLTEQQRKFFGAIAGGAEPYKAQAGVKTCPPGFVNIEGKCFDKASDEYKALYKYGIGYMDDEDTLVSSRMELPEVVLKPKSVLDFLDKIDLGTDANYGGGASRYAFDQLGKKYGFIPNVKILKEKQPSELEKLLFDIFDSSDKKRTLEKTAHYVPFIKTAYVDNIKDYIAELSHHVDPLVDNPGMFLITDLPAIINQKDRYKTKGTSEYRAHEEIQPKLKKDFEKYKREYWDNVFRPMYMDTNDPLLRQERMDDVWNNYVSPVKKKKDGGWLDKYDAPKAQNGFIGPIEDKDAETEFIESWMSSPRYAEMLKRSSGSTDEYNTINQGRLENIRRPYTKSEISSNDLLNEGNIASANVLFSKREYASPFRPGSVDRPSEAIGYDVRYNPKIFNQLSPLGRMSTLIHERSHTSDMSFDDAYNPDKNLLPLKDKELIGSRELLTGRSRYLKQPSEVRARLNELRFLGKQFGVYDPFTEAIDLEKLKQLNKKIPSMGSVRESPYAELEEIYTPEQIVELLNSVSKTSTKESTKLDKYNLPKAQVGIELPGYAKQYLSGRQGDMASYYPDIKRVKEQLKMAQENSLEKVKERVAQKRSRIYDQLRRAPGLKLYSDQELQQYAQQSKDKWPKWVRQMFDDESNIVYNVVNHPDYNPSVPVSSQRELADDNSLRTIILRGRNKLLNSGNPVVDFANSIITAPGSAVANIMFDSQNAYNNPNLPVWQNLLNTTLDAATILPLVGPTSRGVGTVTKNLYKLNPRSGKIPIIGETPHWIKGYPKNYSDPTKIDFSGMANYGKLSRVDQSKLAKLDKRWNSLSQAERNNEAIANQFAQERKQILTAGSLRSTGLSPLFNVDDVMSAGSYSDFVAPLKYSPSTVLKYSSKEPFAGATQGLFQAGKNIRDPQIGIPFHLQELGGTKNVVLMPKMEGQAFGLAQRSAEPISRSAAAQMALKIRQLNKQGIYPDWQGYNFLRDPKTGNVSVIDLNINPGSTASQAFTQGSRIGQNPATIIKQNWNLEPKITPAKEVDNFINKLSDSEFSNYLSKLSNAEKRKLYGLPPYDIDKYLLSKAKNEFSSIARAALIMQRSGEELIHPWIKNTDWRNLGDEFRGVMRQWGLEPTNQKHVEKFRKLWISNERDKFSKSIQPIKFGEIASSIYNPIKLNKKGGPIVNSNGYKDGRPSKGSNWRIPGNTVYNPTGETILAQANTGEQTILQPYDTNSVTFRDADYIDEYHLTDNQPNWLEGYKAKLGGPYNSSWMLTNPKPESVIMPKLQNAGPVKWFESWYSQRKNLPQFTRLAKERLDLLSSPPAVVINPQSKFREDVIAEYVPSRDAKKDVIYLSEPSKSEFGELGHEMTHWLDTRARQSIFRPRGIDKSEPFERYPGVTGVKIKESKLPENVYQWISTTGMLGNKGEVNAILNELRQKEGLKGDVPTTPEQMQMIINKYMSLPASDKTSQSDSRIKTLIKYLGENPEVLSDINNRIVKTKIKKLPKAQGGGKIKDPDKKWIEAAATKHQKCGIGSEDPDCVVGAVPQFPGMPTYENMSNPENLWNWPESKKEQRAFMSNIDARYKMLSQQYPNLTKEALVAAMRDSTRTNPLLANPAYTREFDERGKLKDSTMRIEPFLKYWRGAYPEKTKITVPDILQNLGQNIANYSNLINTGYRKFKQGGQHGGLDRWFAEKWVDVKSGKPCGRQEGENRAYPACRPSKRVSSKTPKTSSELSSEERARFKSTKTSSQRIPYSHKRRK